MFSPPQVPPLPCPGPVVYPFQKLPQICLVAPCPCTEGQSGGDPAKSGCAAGGGGSNPSKAGACAPPPWVKEFHQAAHFPYPRFAADGSPFPLDGLLIYEGMRLTVYPDTGIYDVSFTATVPNMPVTVRMQLVFERTPLDLEGYRITLPPFRLEPKWDAKLGDVSAYTFNVAHRGYCSLFIPHRSSGLVIGGLPVVIDECWRLSRVGTARFGTVIAVDDAQH